jgi:hypothetical protein
MTHLALTVAVIVATACIAPAESPSRFSASIDNFGGHTYSVELRDGRLVYSDTTPKIAAEPITITPSPEQWRAFRSAMDTIGVWTWHEKYMPNEMISDGTSWSLSLRYPDRSIVTGGGNCYPDAHGDPTGVPLRTPAFRQFEAAIEALLGGRSFRSADNAANR